MGNDRIEIDFHSAMESADALDQIAADLENALNNSYGEAMMRLSESWKGTNASFYQEKAAALMEQIQSSVKQIRSGAEEVRRTANRIHKAELLARTLAEARNY